MNFELAWPYRKTSVGISLKDAGGSAPIVVERPHLRSVGRAARPAGGGHRRLLRFFLAPCPATYFAVPALLVWPTDFAK